MIRRVLYYGLCGVVLAGIVHIAIILLIPNFGKRDAARQIVETLPELEFVKLNGSSGINISAADPFFELSACRFKLQDAGVLIDGNNLPSFWSAAVYDNKGRVVYSMNDRTAIGNRLQILVVNPIQMAALRQLQPEELETSIVVETPIREGFILLRAFVREPTQVDSSIGFLEQANCLPYTGI
ncbi:MAG: DUF1254 domain-containing protein [Rhizobiaceae bacterium]|nr:DUF1254 domain-containing protein [Rhizobiaceae bacterium]